MNVYVPELSGAAKQIAAVVAHSHPANLGLHI